MLGLSHYSLVCVSLAKSNDCHLTLSSYAEKCLFFMFNLDFNLSSLFITLLRGHKKQTDNHSMCASTLCHSSGDHVLLISKTLQKSFAMCEEMYINIQVTDFITPELLIKNIN